MKSEHWPFKYEWSLMKRMQTMQMQSININYCQVEVFQLSPVCFGHLSKAMAWSMIMLTVSKSVYVYSSCVRVWVLSFNARKDGWEQRNIACHCWMTESFQSPPECKDQTTDGSQPCVMEVDDVTAGLASGPWVCSFFLYLFSTWVWNLST